MKITISVTALDIASGNLGEPCSCPIALAILRAVPGSDPWVDGDHVYAHPEGNPCIFGTEPVYLPLSAREFVEAFDRAVPVDPFSFELDIPDELMAEVAR